MPATSQPTTWPRAIGAIVDRHSEEAAFLLTLRRAYLHRADVTLRDLEDIDERIESHLDGLRVAQERGWNASRRALANAGAGEIFVAAALALQSKAWDRLHPLLAIVEEEEPLRDALAMAFGWASSRDLEGTIKVLLSSDSAFYRLAALMACSAHGVDPGRGLAEACRDSDVATVRLALRSAGELGRRDLLEVCADSLEHRDPEQAFWAAWAAVLLGDRERALMSLARAALSPSLATVLRRRALFTALRTSELGAGHELLRTMAQQQNQRRWMIEGIGVLGNVRYIPWLVEQMNDPNVARVAGEAFTLITGQELASAKLDRSSEAAAEIPSRDAAEDEEVADASLPWPMAAAVDDWWRRERSRWQDDRRTFMGASPSTSNCIDILKHGRQRHRAAASEYLCLLRPGTPRFDVQAPAWRQRRRLQDVVITE